MEEGRKLKAKVIHKYELEVDWNKSSYIPDEGEFVCYAIEVDKDGKVLCDSDGKPRLPEGRNWPYTYERLKLGDGVHTVKDLGFYGMSDYVPRMFNMDEANGHNRVWYLKNPQLNDDGTFPTTTDTQYNIPANKFAMVRAIIPAADPKDGYINYSDWSYINGYKEDPNDKNSKYIYEYIAPPIKIAWEGYLATPEVTKGSDTETGTEISWDSIEGATKYEILIGDITQYGSYGSFARSNNRLFAEMNQGRGVYTRYIMSGSEVCPLDPDPADYARGYRLDTVVQRLGNKSGENPEYLGHIRVPEHITIPEDASDLVKNNMKCFATSKAYVDNAIKENAIAVQENKTTNDFVYATPSTNGRTVTYNLTQEAENPENNTEVKFQRGEGLYAKKYPGHTYNDINHFSNIASSSPNVTIMPAEDSYNPDVYGIIIKADGTNSGGNITFNVTNGKTTGNKMVFETDFCLLSAEDAIPGDSKDGSGWFMRFNAKDAQGNMWSTSTGKGCLGTYVTNTVDPLKNKYGFSPTNKKNTEWVIGDWIHFRVEQIGTEVRIYVNDVEQFTITANREITDGLIGFVFDMRGYTYSQVLIDNVFFGMTDETTFGKRPFSIPLREDGGQVNVPIEPISDTHAASKAYVDKKLEESVSSEEMLVDAINNISEEEGTTRKYYIKSAEVVDIVASDISEGRASVNLAEGQMIMVRNISGNSLKSDWSYIDKDESTGEYICIASPSNSACDADLVAPTVEIVVNEDGTRTAYWEVPEDLIKTQYLVGTATTYGKHGSFADNNNRIIQMKSNNRGFSTRMCLTKYPEAPLDDDPHDYSRGAKLQSIPQRLGNMDDAGNLKPGYEGHITVPKTMPDPAEDPTVEYFAVSRKVADKLIDDRARALKKELTEFTEDDEGKIPMVVNGVLTLVPVVNAEEGEY